MTGPLILDGVVGRRWSRPLASHPAHGPVESARRYSPDVSANEILGIAGLAVAVGSMLYAGLGFRFQFTRRGRLTLIPPSEFAIAQPATGTMLWLPIAIENDGARPVFVHRVRATLRGPHLLPGPRAGDAEQLLDLVAFNNFLPPVRDEDANQRYLSTSLVVPAHGLFTSVLEFHSASGPPPIAYGEFSVALTAEIHQSRQLPPIEDVSDPPRFRLIVFDLPLASPPTSVVVAHRIP